MVLVKNKKYKKYIAEGIFILCIVLAFNSIYNIMEYRKIFAQEESIELQRNDEKDDYLNNLVLFNFSKDMKINMDELNKTPMERMSNQFDQVRYAQFPLWFQGLWELVNVVLYLFLGGLIYAKNRAFED